MFHRIRRQAAEPSETQRRHFELSARLEGQIPPEAERVRAELERAEPTPVVDDFLPPELRVLSHDQLDGRMTSWKQPLVLDGEMVACAECGAYRDWLILSTRDQIWLRCRAGHQQQETRLDIAWYNRHTGPVDATHTAFEDCLRYLDQ
ncbi:hypothetical protein J7F01_41270 [Streptomyces sp. ISL-22]|uniref:hypothetical protein n=1 Tax=unclassified Streptomyces TaxID=2593676 RepID=UPI001BE63E8E|nr:MULTISPECIES: hypothetical protein [unclassified Streptomyces]MBT2423435.1 hypothetical protein [Streptomyces sp. ISL-24]MBT2438422.1 hypothetical protein [Streptomyces sp. ISL-22]